MVMVSWCCARTRINKKFVNCNNNDKLMRFKLKSFDRNVDVAVARVTARVQDEQITSDVENVKNLPLFSLDCAPIAIENQCRRYS